MPKAALAVIALALLVLLGGAAVYAYRMYDFIQHDNEFCLSCHLMVDPYERFARSAHRDLGCKSCHKPTLAARSKMALTQIIERPEELQEHAVVSNQKCEACHVKGDPEKWSQIANTAGHRVHLESDDPALRGVKCVECHSSSVHEFAASDKTCGQAGCHENVQIRLGKMSKLTLHCALCHDFTRSVARTNVRPDSLEHVLAPKARECLSCHQMRRLVADQFAGSDPHDAQCALCHDPHKQTTPRAAVQSCATSGCHTSPETLTPMHRGLGTGVLQQCMQCHAAHKFAPPAGGCLGCHRDIHNEQVRGITTTAQTQPQSRFSHARHRQVACESCHNSADRHGAVTVRSTRDCQSCHHSAPVAANCGSCHEAREFAQRTYASSQQLSLSVGEARVRTRAVSFDHRPHNAIACGQCHTQDITQSAGGRQCISCHQDHHKPTVSCLSCHPATATTTAAHTSKVHVTCSGAGCHTKLPVPGIPRTRDFCLTCHQDMVQHRPAGNCADCHRLPAARN